MNVSFISLGCDKNRVNTEQMMALCLQAGHTVQEDCSGSDVVVINTCGFIDRGHRYHSGGGGAEGRR